jgi:hypothetical protein
MFDYKQIKNDDYVEIVYENYFQGSGVRFVGIVIIE